MRVCHPLAAAVVLLHPKGAWVEDLAGLVLASRAADMAAPQPIVPGTARPAMA